MSTQAVRYAVTSLSGLNKAGILNPDADGYRIVVVGALNIYNECGEYYTADKTRALFEGVNDFQRRIERGALRGEVDHPFQLPGMTDDQYLERMFYIDPKNTCCQFRKIWLAPELGKNGEIPILAEVIPSGVHHLMLEKQFSNPSENVCFSVRGFTEDDFVRGRLERALRMIITFDYVNEPGIPIAEKYFSPSLESKHWSVKDRIITPNTFRRLAQSKNEYAMECLRLSTEAIANFGWEAPKNVRLTMSKWSG